MKKYNCGNFELHLSENGGFTLAKAGREYKEYGIAHGFAVSLSGAPLYESDFSFVGAKENGKTLELVYKNAEKGISVTTQMEFSDCGVISQKNTAENIGSQTLNLTEFSSAFLNCAESEEDAVIHICRNDWQCEGQWRKFSPSQLGLCPSTIHSWAKKSHCVGTTGSWSTSGYYPLVMIENQKTSDIWFMETEGSHSWEIKITEQGGYGAPHLSLLACGCSENLGNWHYELKPGETYSTERAFFGMCENGFEGAVSCLNSFKRADSLVKYPAKVPPVVFNDYMNCLWLDQSPQKIITLIEKAAQVGCEVFCIDDGWQITKGGKGHGDWIPKDERVLKEIADKIKSCGMIPGIWFELDACMDSAYGYKPDENWILKRYGEPVGGKRAFYNFGLKEVRDYLFERVKALYDLGFRFIKNDYNQSTGIGCTNNYDGNSPAEGLIRNTNSFYEFIDSLYERLPGLIIENCGSGAMRDDNKMLRRAMLQSTSDQEIYLNNPSVMMGSMAIMPPEKAGVWTYPYPLLFGKDESVLKSEEYANGMKNGFETSFNMITAMFGSMYLSGRIDMCDEFNLSLIKSAIEIYKKYRVHIANSHPIYPTGMSAVNESGIASFALLSDKSLLLAVWNINSAAQKASFDISKYASGAYLECAYPQMTNYACEGDVLSVNLPENSAAFFAYKI